MPSGSDAATWPRLALFRRQSAYVVRRVAVILFSPCSVRQSVRTEHNHLCNWRRRRTDLSHSPQGSSSGMGQKSSWLRVENGSSSDIIDTNVCGTNYFHWKNSSDRPDINFQGVRIPSGSISERKEVLYRPAHNCPFTMTLTFADGSKDTFRIYQKYARGQLKSGFRHTVRSHEIYYRREGKTLVIEVLDSEEAEQERRAEQLHREGLALQGEGRLQEALGRFQQALGLARRSATADAVRGSQAACRQLQLGRVLEGAELRRGAAAAARLGEEEQEEQEEQETEACEVVEIRPTTT